MGTRIARVISVPADEDEAAARRARRQAAGRDGDGGESQGAAPAPGHTPAHAPAATAPAPHAVTADHDEPQFSDDEGDPVMDLVGSVDVYIDGEQAASIEIVDDEPNRVQNGAWMSRAARAVQAELEPALDRLERSMNDPALSAALLGGYDTGNGFAAFLLSACNDTAEYCESDVHAIESRCPVMSELVKGRVVFGGNGEQAA